jgi:hypothetical protein
MVVTGVFVLNLSTIGVSHGYFFQVHFAHRALPGFGVGFISFALHGASVPLCVRNLLNGGCFGSGGGTLTGAGASKQCTKRQNKKYLFHT